MMLTGVAAIVGGFLYGAHAVVVAVRPEGCVALECDISGARPRPTEDLAPLFLVGVSLLALVIVSLASARWREGARSPLLDTGVVLSSAGVLALLAGIWLNRVYVDENPLWFLVDTDSGGRLLPTLATLFVGIAAIRGQVLSRRVGFVLVGAALAVVGFNAQDGRVLWALPLAFAWCLAGLSAAAQLKASTRNPG